MRDLYSNDLEGAAYYAREYDAYERNYNYNDYDHDYEDDAAYRALYMPDETDELLSIIDRIANIFPVYVPVTFLPNYDPNDLPF